MIVPRDTINNGKYGLSQTILFNDTISIEFRDLSMIIICMSSLFIPNKYRVI